MYICIFRDQWKQYYDIRNRAETDPTIMSIIIDGISKTDYLVESTEKLIGPIDNQIIKYIALNMYL